MPISRIGISALSVDALRRVDAAQLRQYDDEDDEDDDDDSAFAPPPEDESHRKIRSSPEAARKRRSVTSIVAPPAASTAVAPAGFVAVGPLRRPPVPAVVVATTTTAAAAGLEAVEDESEAIPATVTLPRPAPGAVAPPRPAAAPSGLPHHPRLAPARVAPDNMSATTMPALRHAPRTPSGTQDDAPGEPAEPRTPSSPGGPSPPAFVEGSTSTALLPAPLRHDAEAEATVAERNTTYTPPMPVMSTTRFLSTASTRPRGVATGRFRMAVWTYSPTKKPASKATDRSYLHRHVSSDLVGVILGFLPISDLAIASQVCRGWFVQADPWAYTEQHGWVPLGPLTRATAVVLRVSLADRTVASDLLRCLQHGCARLTLELSGSAAAAAAALPPVVYKSRRVLHLAGGDALPNHQLFGGAARRLDYGQQHMTTMTENGSSFASPVTTTSAASPWSNMPFDEGASLSSSSAMAFFHASPPLHPSQTANSSSGGGNYAASPILLLSSPPAAAAGAALLRGADHDLGDETPALRQARYLNLERPSADDLRLLRERLIPRMPVVETLRVGRVSLPMGAREIASLVRGTKLREVRLHKVNNLTRSTLTAMFAGTPNLAVVVLEHCVFVTERRPPPPPHTGGPAAGGGRYHHSAGTPDWAPALPVAVPVERDPPSKFKVSAKIVAAAGEAASYRVLDAHATPVASNLSGAPSANQHHQHKHQQRVCARCVLQGAACADHQPQQQQQQHPRTTRSSLRLPIQSTQQPHFQHGSSSAAAAAVDDRVAGPAWNRTPSSFVSLPLQSNMTARRSASALGSSATATAGRRPSSGVELVVSPLPTSTTPGRVAMDAASTAAAAVEAAGSSAARAPPPQHAATPSPRTAPLLHANRSTPDEQVAPPPVNSTPPSLNRGLPLPAPLAAAALSAAGGGAAVSASLAGSQPAVPWFLHRRHAAASGGAPSPPVAAPNMGGASARASSLNANARPFAVPLPPPMSPAAPPMTTSSSVDQQGWSAGTGAGQASDATRRGPAAALWRGGVSRGGLQTFHNRHEGVHRLPPQE